MGTRTRSVMSAELVWLCVRNNSCFRYSGLAQKKVVGLEAGEKGVVLTTKSKGNSRKPSKLFVKSTLNKDIRRVAKSIKNACSDYRPDLERVPLARASALFRAKRAQEIGVK